PQDDNGSKLVWFYRAGKQVGVLWNADSYLDVTLSPDRKWASVSIASGQNPNARDLWLLDGSNGMKTTLTSRPAYARTSVWSPDGTRVVYASARKSDEYGRRRYDLYERAVKGGDDKLVVEDPTNKFPDSWSPDGKYILYLSNDHDLFVVPQFGDR